METRSRERTGAYQIPGTTISFDMKTGNRTRIDVYSGYEQRHLTGNLFSIPSDERPGLYIVESGGAMTATLSLGMAILGRKIEVGKRQEASPDNSHIMAKTLMHLLRNGVFAACISNSERSGAADKMGEKMRELGASVEYFDEPFSGRLIYLPQNKQLAHQLYSAAEKQARNTWRLD